MHDTFVLQDVGRENPYRNNDLDSLSDSQAKDILLDTAQRVLDPLKSPVSFSITTLSFTDYISIVFAIFLLCYFIAIPTLYHVFFLSIWLFLFLAINVSLKLNSNSQNAIGRIKFTVEQIRNYGISSDVSSTVI
jgi:hypothetical protein